MSYLLVGDWYGTNAPIPMALVGPSWDPARFAGLGALGALGAASPSMIRSALSSAQAQSARGNSSEAYRALQQARDWLGELPTTSPEFVALQGEIATTSTNVSRNLSRPQSEIDRYNEGVRAGELAQSTYRDYSDVRRSVVDDLEDAARKTADDIRTMAGEASPWLQGAFVIAGLFAVGYAIRSVR